MRSAGPGELAPTETTPPCRVLLAMPAYSRGVGLGAKMVTMFANNAERGIPSHQGIVLVFCPETGTLQAVSLGPAPSPVWV